MTFEDAAKQVIKNVSVYGDNDDKSALYAEYFTHGGTVKMLTPIESPSFQSYLRTRIRKLSLKKISASAITEYIRDFFTTEAIPPRITTYVRIAGNLRSKRGECQLIEYNLCNDLQQSVIITPDGWKISNKSYHKFLSLSQTLPQITPAPSDGSLIEMIGKYVNITGDMLVLFVIWLVQAFSLSAHNALIISAERGSGKSSASRAIRTLIDPSSLEISTYPSKFDDLQTTLSNSYLSVFDNMSDISKKESDLLCSAITGATVAKRELFTTNELYVQKIFSTVVMNGIFVFPTESDLSERCLLIKMKKLTAEAMKTESSLWDEFDRDKPYILGLIFDTLSSAMHIINSLTQEKLNRLADAHLEMIAIAGALGIDKDNFNQILRDNRIMLEQERANTPLVEAVREFMNSPLVPGRKASGTVEQVYSQIKSVYSGEKRDLPRSPSRFSQSLKAERDTLDVAGYVVNLDDTPSDGTHLAIIKRKAR